MNRTIEGYFADGCGRCPLGGTPDCKVHAWRPILEALRDLLRSCGLEETVKWGMPCYQYQGANVVILGAFKEFASLGFFKGSLLQNADGILTRQGENSEASRVIKVVELAWLRDWEEQVRACIYEAIEVEKSGLKVATRTVEEEDFPEVIRQRLAEMPDLRNAFFALTPGRRKGYLLYFKGAAQDKTRLSRLEKQVSRIMNGKGLHD
jgi:uncharacterized protein YdeI (YjbR/CyaY-like superfamily)